MTQRPALRFLAVLLALTLVASACGDDTTDAVADGGDAAADTTDDAADAGDDAADAGDDAADAGDAADAADDAADAGDDAADAGDAADAADAGDAADAADAADDADAAADAGDDAADAGDDAADAAPGLATPDNPSDREGDLVVWHYFNNEGPLNSINAGIERFQAAYPNVDLSVEVFPYTDFTQKVLTSAAAQTGPDFMFYNWADQVQLLEVNALLPIDPYWETYAEADQVPASGVNRVGDEIYSVRVYGNLIALWYNADLLAELGADPPTSLDDMEATMRLATEAGYKGLASGFNAPILGWWTGMPYVFAECGDLTLGDEAVVRAAIERPVRWVEEGLMTPEVVTYDQSGAVDQFLTGEYVFATAGNWDLTRIIDSAEFTLGSLPIPGASCDGGVYVSGEGFSIGSFGGNPDLGFEFARLAIMDAEAQANFLGLAGSIPGHPSLFNSPAVQENPLLGAYLLAASTFGKKAPSTLGENEAQALFGETLIGALAGDMSVDEAVDLLVSETPSILAQDG